MSRNKLFNLYVSMSVFAMSVVSTAAGLLGGGDGGGGFGLG